MKTTKTKTTRRRNGFSKRDGSTYKCDTCGRQTRHTGAQSVGSKLCPQCWDLAGIENELSDGHATIDELRAQIMSLLDEIREKGGDPDENFAGLIAKLVASIDISDLSDPNDPIVAAGIAAAAAEPTPAVVETPVDEFVALDAADQSAQLEAEAARVRRSRVRIDTPADVAMRAEKARVRAEQTPADAEPDSIYDYTDASDRADDLAEDYPGQYIDGPDTPPADVPAQDVVDAAEQFVDAALRRHSTTDETFVECRCCGGFDEHVAGCLVPAVERWLSEPTQPTSTCSECSGAGHLTRVGVWPAVSAHVPCSKCGGTGVAVQGGAL